MLWRMYIRSTRRSTWGKWHHNRLSPRRTSRSPVGGWNFHPVDSRSFWLPRKTSGVFRIRDRRQLLIHSITSVLSSRIRWFVERDWKLSTPFSLLRIVHSIWISKQKVKPNRFKTYRNFQINMNVLIGKEFIRSYAEQHFFKNKISEKELVYSTTAVNYMK